MTRNFLFLSVAIVAASLPTIGLSAETTSPAWGVDLSAMDRKVDPGDDFYRYVNGTWLASAQIPPDRGSIGIWTNLMDSADEEILAILADLAPAPGKQGPTGKKVYDFYSSYMDTDTIEANGLKSLKPLLAEINAVSNRRALMAVMAKHEMPRPITIGVLNDPGDASHYITAIAQGGITLPSAEYYLGSAESHVKARVAYRAYVEQMFTLAGIGDAAKRADRVIALETAIAAAHWEPARMRDIRQIYNVMSVDDLRTLAPQFGWDGWLGSLGLAGQKKFWVAHPSAIGAVGGLLDTVPLESWKDYLTFQTIDGAADYLPERFENAHFAFHSTALNGVTTARPRSVRGIAQLNSFLGDGVGQLYAKRYFPPEARAQMAELIGNLEAALAERFRSNPWMDEATRQEALTKLSLFEPHIGYPDQWIDYSSLRIDRKDLLGNVVRSVNFGWQEDLARLAKPVDRNRWPTTPQTVNAFYQATTNQITFPAAVLRPPMFDPKADPAVNYGAAGAVIGHEIGHGFDDGGRRYDGTGALRDWWTPEASAKFDAIAAKLGAQYAAQEPLPGVHINPALTMGENIGDLGGLEMAWTAWRRYVAKNGEPPVIDGFTGDQRFFLAWAQVWRGLIRDDLQRQVLATDGHSPNYARVNIVLANIDGWYDAFKVTPDDDLYIAPEKRVRIW